MYIYSLLIPSKQGGEKLSAEGTQPSDGNVALNTSLQWAALNIQQGVWDRCQTKKNNNN